MIAYRENDILPGVGYPEKWLLVPIPFKSSQLKVGDIEFIKNWADEPLHEIDYILIVTPSNISHELEDWILKFNRFPIKKYKIKYFDRFALEQIICSKKDLLDDFFKGFTPKEQSEENLKEIEEIIIRKLLNFRSDLGIVDIYLNVLFTFSEENQKAIANKIAYFWSHSEAERLKRWNCGWILIRLAKLKPDLIPLKVVEKVALEAEDSYKAQAAHIYAWLSLTKPYEVDPEVLGRMITGKPDYFVYVPIIKAISNLLQSSETDTMNILLNMLKSEDRQTRYVGAKIVDAIAEENPMLVPASICKLVNSDPDPEVQKLAVEISDKVLSFWEAPLRSEFRKAIELFDSKEYRKAQFIFDKLGKKEDFSLRNESIWWSGYCSYLLRNYSDAIRIFSSLKKIESMRATGHWWVSICYEKMGHYDKSREEILEIRKLPEGSTRIKISPDRELSVQEIASMLFKRLKELNEALER